VNAGKLRHQVQLTAPPDATKPDSFGDVSTAPTPAGLVWVGIVPGSGREFWMSQQTRADLTHIITMRYRSDVGPRWQIVWNDGFRTRTFELGPPLTTDERFFEMKFTAMEKRSQ